MINLRESTGSGEIKLTTPGPSNIYFCSIYLLTLLTNVSVEETGVDPDQTALHCF